MNRVIDIIRTSSSRPKELMMSTGSIQSHLKFSGTFRWLLHEDVILREQSERCVRFAHQSGYSVVGVDDPPIGQGKSLTWLIDRTTSSYFFSMEDDWYFLADIDVDQLITLMDNHPEINQIAFHKRIIQPKKDEWVKKNVVIDGVPLVVAPRWSFIPSLWRASFIKPIWSELGSPTNWQLADYLIARFGLKDAMSVMCTTGTYFLGFIGSGHYVEEYPCKSANKGELG
jgi:hypothetical protein